MGVGAGFGDSGRAGFACGRFREPAAGDLETVDFPFAGGLFFVPQPAINRQIIANAVAVGSNLNNRTRMLLPLLAGIN